MVCEYLRAGIPNLIELIGERPIGWKWSIDRINTLGNYSCGKCAECLDKEWPKNVRWATPTIQNRNQRRARMVTINGITKCLSEWAEEIGISDGALRLRIERGWIGNELMLPIRSYVLMGKNKR